MLFWDFLNSSLQNDDNSLVLNGYKLVRANYPNNLKRGCVCIYLNKSLPIKVINITSLHESFVCELFWNRSWSYIVSLYWSPIESSDDYDHFIKTFEQLIVHLNSFRPGDVDNVDDTWLESITSFQGLYQINNKPIHILSSLSSCIDLIFTNQPNMITDSEVHPSLRQNFNLLIILAKLFLKIFYPPPYKRLVLHYHNANVEAINSVIEYFNWQWPPAVTSLDAWRC